MSKQDIEKRLGFAAQGVKAEMAIGSYKQGDRTVTVNGKKYEVLPYQMDFFIKELATLDTPEWRADVVKEYLRRGYIKATASRPGVKIKFSAQFEVGRVYEHSFIGDYDAIVQWKVLSRTESTLTIKKVGEGNRNSATTPTRGEEKRVKINSDAQGEFVYPMGKFSMAPILRASKTTAARPGVKAKMENSDGNYFTINGYVDNSIWASTSFNTQAEAEYSGKRVLEALKKSHPKAKNVNVQILKVVDYSPQKLKTLSLRPGVKAKMSATFIVAEAIFNAENAVRRGDNENARRWIKAAQDAMDETVVSTGMRSKLEQLVKRYKMSRPGVKAKFATEVGRKGNKSAMISRDATGTWYAYVVQRIETGIGKDEDMLGTMRAYSTEDRAKRAAIKALDTSGFSRPGVKAKMGSSQVNDSATTADLIREAQRLRDVIKTSNREFDKTHLRQIKQELDRRGVLMPYGASEVLASRSGMKAKA